MASDIVVNGETYPSVESVALTDSDGNTVQFYPDAVRYVAQELSDEQKAQARKNIGISNALEAAVSSLTIFSNAVSNCTQREPAIISFVDDDCRAASYQAIKESGIPYAVSCAPANLGKDGYMTGEQLQELYRSGVQVLSHHMHEEGMHTFLDADAYRENTRETIDALKAMGIVPVGVAYPNGIIKPECLPVVKEFFRLGFTVDRGVNRLPYESCYIKRNELFPADYNAESESRLDAAKAMVDSVAQDGGWLVFMTHAWYEKFSAADLNELAAYIQQSGAEIVGIDEVLRKYANPVDIGVIKKPLEEMSEPFYVTDCMGRTYTNSIDISKKSSIRYTQVDLSMYATKCYIGQSGKTIYNENGDSNRIVKEKIAIPAQTKSCRMRNLSAKYSNLYYAVFDASGALLTSLSADGQENGFIEETIIDMPDNADHMSLSGDKNNGLFQADWLERIAPPEEPEPTPEERMEAQVLYTALMTDTLLEV